MEYREEIGVGRLYRWVRGPALTFVLGFAAATGVYEAKARSSDVAAATLPATAVPVEAAGLREMATDPIERDLAMVAAASEPAATAVAPAAPTWDLPNLDHDRVDDFVRMFTGSKRDEFAGFLSRMGYYRPMISAKLEARGMPQDLIYLAMIESGFRAKAYSPAHASGLWQFISGTGSRYGLDINRAVDERNDPEKATDAALDYLQDLHDQFGSWYLAAAAYNSGEGRVARVMRQVTGSQKGDERSYYRIRSRLPRETRDYVPLMVAAARIAKEPHRYGFEDVEPEAPLAYDTVTVDPATSLESIAKAAGATVKEIRTLNPHFKLNRTRNDMRSAVRIPAGSRVAFDESVARTDGKILATAKPETRTHRIRRGDNLSTIGRRYGVSVTALKQANGLRGSRIRAGATLRIPVEG